MKDEKDLEQKTDEELMMLYQSGSIRAFDLIYQRYSSRVLAYLRKRCKSDRSADDLLQEVFLKLHRSRDQYNQMLPLAPWIFSISRSVFLDAVKKKNLEHSTEPEKFDHFPAALPVSADTNLELLETLPSQQKEVVSLRVFDDATFEEIASRLSTSPENARQIFSRGIRKLKSTLMGKE